jgi:hypothetical protein
MIKALVQSGFEYVTTTIDGLMLFRKNREVPESTHKSPKVRGKGLLTVFVSFATSSYGM